MMDGIIMLNFASKKKKTEHFLLGYILFPLTNYV